MVWVWILFSSASYGGGGRRLEKRITSQDGEDVLRLETRRANETHFFKLNETVILDGLHA